MKFVVVEKGKEHDLDVLSEFQMVPRPAWRLPTNFQFAGLHDRRDRRRATTAHEITSDYSTGICFAIVRGWISWVPSRTVTVPTWSK